MQVLFSKKIQPPQDTPLWMKAISGWKPGCRLAHDSAYWQ
jgi:hypothetical protein